MENRKPEIPSYVEKIMNKLEKQGFPSWIVGGSVRDALLGREVHDYDLCTTARPWQVMELFDHCVPIGIAHGTVLVIEEGHPVEVTTLRKEGAYKDHRKPESVEFTDSIIEDLARRDFTINAMAYNPKDGLIDPYNGMEDLNNKVLRAVGNPALRFEEDALRLFRAWRIAGKLGFEIEEKTLEAMKEKEDLAKTLSVERVREEMEQILRDSPQQIANMTILLKPWIPELEIMAKTEQNSVYHYTDVLHHTLDAIEAAPDKDPVVLWSLLLHDTGKPECKTTDAKGDHFKKHPAASARIAKRVVKDLKMPKAMAREIVDLVLYHDAFYAPRLSNIYKLRIARGQSDAFLRKLWKVQEGDIAAHTTKDRMKELDAFRDFYEKEIQNRPLSPRDLAISGDDIKQALDLQPREIGGVINLLLEHMFYFPKDNNKAKALQLLPGFYTKLQKEEKTGPFSV